MSSSQAGEGVPLLADGPASAPDTDTVPDVLKSEHELEYRESFLAEFRPVGRVEKYLVRELARQAAAMDRWTAAAGAIERQGARHLPDLTAATGLSCESADAVLAAIMSSQQADRAERHCVARHRAFMRTYDQLTTLLAERRAAQERQKSHPLIHFADEDACIQYLAELFRSGRRACRRCGSIDGYVLTARRVWECTTCSAQTGLRTGTVMSGSAIPIVHWFLAICSVLTKPTIGNAELACKVGIRRLATVRAMARRIREAIASDDASTRLAGLDEYLTRAST